MSKRKHAEEGNVPTQTKETTKRPKLEADGKVNGVGHSAESSVQLTAGKQQWRTEKKKHNRNKELEKKISKAWLVSDSHGGRLLDLDPVFSEDEKYVLLAQAHCIKVFACRTSLSVRTLAVKSKNTVASFALSICDPSRVFVALDSGRIECWDWQEGTRLRTWNVNAQLSTLQVADLQDEGESHDVLYVADNVKGRHTITAHRFGKKDGEQAAEVRTLLETEDGITQLRLIQNGQVIVAATPKKLFIGSRKGSKSLKHLTALFYTWKELPYSHTITTLDARAVTDAESRTSKKVHVDIAVGTREGIIFLYYDIQSQLREAEIKKQQSPQVSRLHWHRNAVGSLKWSLDGNYVISGGSETVLVLWQLDTGKRQDLPHLASAIESIVVSPLGSSYAIRLADNSLMVLSTLELQPTVNIPGIQLADHFQRRPGAQVDANQSQSAVLYSSPHRKLPFTASTQSSQLLFAVPAVSSSRHETKHSSSAAYLQALDSTTGTQITKQALVPTKVTDRNAGPEGNILEEPNVVLIKTSHDGKWLATIDEWMPPNRDLQHSLIDERLSQHKRKQNLETYLKFWSWNEPLKSWELAWRVDNPHTPEEESVISYGMILDLAYDPTREGFFTLGDDGNIKRWSPRTRLRHGLPVRDRQNDVLANWFGQTVGRIALPAAMTMPVTIPSYLLGRLAVSQDATVLAAAIDMGAGAKVATFPIRTGEVAEAQRTQNATQIGDIGFLDKYLIVLGDNLTVWDLVNDAQVYSIKLSMQNLSKSRLLSNVHLAVDRRNQTYLVAVDDAAGTSSSKIAVFSPQSATPVFTTEVPNAVVGVESDPSHRGYIVVDNQSEIRHLAPATHLPVASADDNEMSNFSPNFKSLEGVFGTTQKPLVQGQSKSTAIAIPAVTGATLRLELENGDSELVDQHQISSIWSTKQAMALPPIATMFAQVAALVSKKAAQTV